MLAGARLGFSVPSSVLLSVLLAALLAVLLVLFRSVLALVVELLRHPVEMAFERIHVGRPEPPERRQPLVDVSQRLGPDPIDAPLGLDPRFHEAGLSQDAEVL